MSVHTLLGGLTGPREYSSIGSMGGESCGVINLWSGLWFGLCKFSCQFFVSFHQVLWGNHLPVVYHQLFGNCCFPATGTCLNSLFGHYPLGEQQLTCVAVSSALWKSTLWESLPLGPTLGLVAAVSSEVASPPSASLFPFPSPSSSSSPCPSLFCCSFCFPSRRSFFFLQRARSDSGKALLPAFLLNFPWFPSLTFSFSNSVGGLSPRIEFWVLFHCGRLLQRASRIVRLPSLPTQDSMPCSCRNLVIFMPIELAD